MRPSLTWYSGAGPIKPDLRPGMALPDVGARKVVSAGPLGRVARSYASGFNSSPVSSLGKKNVDFGGMFSPAAATSLTWATGVGRMKNAAS